MQSFGNVATAPERKVGKVSGKGYYEFRMCESQRGKDDSPTWYTCRIMKNEDPGLLKGDFVKVTGKLKADFYLSREGKPTGTLLIIAFEAAKITKQVAASEAEESSPA
ncbi:single-strand-binding protein/primosomal replication protein n [Duganella sp. FT135W]|uniref:Single-strand-binding protein/primosomal replication protein n n=1 Tax=Duganella flavida TaxID=2692175 RepID=A0A6L8K7P6_9BURK|nr:single-strand-binding protein/primosomal replication protein n [Duganella flavida]MYM23220.1 single-strand-binding protein/primosomal replication protein n [Duganella flavida]